RLEEGTRDQRLAQRPDVQQPQRRQHQPEKSFPDSVGGRDGGIGREQDREHHREGDQPDARVRHVRERADEHERDHCAHFRHVPGGGYQEKYYQGCAEHKGPLVEVRNYNAAGAVPSKLRRAATMASPITLRNARIRAVCLRSWCVTIHSSLARSGNTADRRCSPSSRSAREQGSSAAPTPARTAISWFTRLLLRK